MIKKFSPEEFKLRKGMSLGEYEFYITKRAIECGLISETEMHGLKQNFKVVFGYPLAKSVQLIDNLVKLRLANRIDQEHYDKINKIANKSESFIDGILKASDKLKKDDNNSRGKCDDGENKAKTLGKEC